MLWIGEYLSLNLRWFVHVSSRLPHFNWTMSGCLFSTLIVFLSQCAGTCWYLVANCGNCQNAKRHYPLKGLNSEPLQDDMSAIIMNNYFVSSVNWGLYIWINVHIVIRSTENILEINIILQLFCFYVLIYWLVLGKTMILLSWCYQRVTWQQLSNICDTVKISRFCCLIQGCQSRGDKTAQVIKGLSHIPPHTALAA